MPNEKLFEVRAARDFSNTLFGNIRQGQKMNISAARRRVWREQGLIVDDTPDINKMNKKQLVEFAQGRFDIELDKRQKIDNLRADVQALVDSID